MNEHKGRLHAIKWALKAFVNSFDYWKLGDFTWLTAKQLIGIGSSSEAEGK